SDWSSDVCSSDLGFDRRDRPTVRLRRRYCSRTKPILPGALRTGSPSLCRSRAAADKFSRHPACQGCEAFSFMTDVTQERILAALRQVKDPERGNDIVSLGMVSGVQ